MEIERKIYTNMRLVDQKINADHSADLTFESETGVRYVARNCYPQDFNSTFDEPAPVTITLTVDYYRLTQL